MKIFSKRVLVGLSVCSLMAVSAVVGAAAANVKVTADLCKGMILKYNGVEQKPVDGKGNRLYPISYNNSMYIPLKAVGSMMNTGVSVDNGAQAIYVGAAPEKPQQTTDNTPVSTSYSIDNPAPLNVAQKTKCVYGYNGKYYKADLVVKFTDLKTGEDARSFAKSSGVSLSSLKSDMDIVAAKVTYSYSNVSTNDASGAYVSSWFSPRTSVHSAGYFMIGGTDYFTGGLGKVTSSAKLSNGVSKSYTGWVLYPVQKGATDSKIGFYGDHESTDYEYADYIWFKLTK